jgi:hypothetical protein
MEKMKMTEEEEKRKKEEEKRLHVGLNFIF